MPHTLGELARALGLQVHGDPDLTITGAAEPAAAGPEELALASTPAYAEALARGRARAAMLWDGADWRALGLAGALCPARPRFAMAGLTAALDPGPGFAPGRHPSAVVDPRAEIGPDVSIGPLAVIEAGARIGAGAVIGPQCYVGADAAVGPGALLREGVRIAARVRIGARVVAQPGCVVGGDGFSFVTPSEAGVEQARAALSGEVAPAPAQSWERIHSLGAVSVGDDVEIGANSCIDRGTIRDTVIGDGTKLDNLVQIGHNVVVGRDCLFAGQVGVAGSTRIGDHVVLGGQVGVADNLQVGDNAVIAAGSKVLSNVPAGRVMLGYPATRLDAQVDSYKALRRLPRLFRDVAALKKAVSKADGSD
ncbi:UDP-3-O-(3-hydroxymyristoyl)glucosamine N-acyltransferase [Rhodosalinus halophilus]|uniref:UDP-3-O-acylglucosamine N-acyltransferase n=1 Tax=Rhodosalinus halophilus TaxID=2259333 RepID=A0A365U875_9RHOB|nr:UDP-3-O-(3-hydroxymyristoyl)glucosamine N-acyltransferase [Rhodosalinus halophilus]RBI84930.1 UDP-3-O-(3-hydroxymyristoyl)glucosamine N-acyltransferase [Rhodosalinus halophilus]